ncbi:sigma-70 family RNA polymerase sigma factor [Echinicola marina]|uniref:RNA polymerase sigma factor n=1 Tax=Echinicola marina TaxID=2859768 RepID=UPI001CF68506|nr:sigma-70 family RNA polymerase sigma factor [Echinicola marina]UCS92118.1 sigma-70 family RNA polymerase sigma factor [Echinicola marina]
MYTYSSDKEILDRIKNNDAMAFRVLFEHFWESLFAAALKRIKSQDLSKDIVQEILADIWNRRHSLEIKSSLKSYLHTAVKYHVLKVYQQNRMLEEFDISRAFQHSDTDNHLAFNELLDTLEIALDKLPERQQLIFRMSRYDGLSSQEIAEKLNLSEQTIFNNLHKTLSTLRTELKDYSPVVILFLMGLLE